MQIAESEQAPWPIKDIIYVSIISFIMMAALLEWMLWLLAFVYCLMKVFCKAQGDSKWSIRLMAAFNMVVFIGMRCIFLPIMIVTLPLPAQIVQHLPDQMVSVLQWFAFYTFAALLTIPWLFCVYQLVTHDIGRKQRIRHVLDENNAPKIVILMPCYNEEPEVLVRTVDSIVECDYPSSCMHIFLSFDGNQVDELYLTTIDKLGVPLSIKEYPTSIDLVYKQCRITVSRFSHGGKRCCQKHTFKLIDKVYQEYLRRHDDLFMLFIDSDCILDKYCIQSFLYEMELRPGSKHNMLAQTGVITSTTKRNSLITILQDMEYVHGQLFERTVESGCGAVTCLPGALTILRFSAFRQVARWYFADQAEHCQDMFDYGQMHLGEDRWLTHLFMITCTKRHQIQMNTGAFCKTEAVQTFRSLLKQRRRWFLGFVTNEAVMLSDIRLWRRYPILMIIRLTQDTIRTTALLFFIMVISIITTSQKVTNLPVGFIAVSLGLNWALMLYFGAKLGRYKVMLFPIMFVIYPFFNWLYLVYGVFTAGQRTWGGPRADAGKAELEAAEQGQSQARASADDLVAAKAAVARANSIKKKKTAPPGLIPSDRVQGRFKPAQSLPGGWFHQANGSGVLTSAASPRRRLRRRRRGSKIHTSPDSSTSRSPARPRRVQSLLNMRNNAPISWEQRLDQHQVADTPRQEKVIGTCEAARKSHESIESDNSTPLHFDVPRGRRSQRMNVPASPPQPESATKHNNRPLSGLNRSSSQNATSDHDRRREESIAHLAIISTVNLLPSATRTRSSMNERRGRSRFRGRSISVDASGRKRLSKLNHST